jgi:hypothetical protein
MSVTHSRLRHAACLGRSSGARAGAVVARRSMACAGVLLAVAGWVALFAAGLVLLLTGAAYLIDVALADQPAPPAFGLALLIAMLLSISRLHRRLPPP